MTNQEFVDAVLTLGLTFEPALDVNRSCQMQCREDPARDQRSSVEMKEGIALAEWGKHNRVLEVGTGFGISTICLAHRAIEVVTVDPNEWVRSGVIQFPPHVRQHASISEVYGPFDLAFIDGLHDYESVKADIAAVLPLVRKGGHVAFHDFNHDPVMRAVYEIPWPWRETVDTVGQLTRCQVPD